MVARPEGLPERRRVERRLLKLDLKYKVNDADETRTSRTRNVTQAGVNILTEHKLKLGDKLQMEITCIDRSIVKCAGEVVWSGELITEGKQALPRPYESGVRFIDLSKEDREKILP